ncbi:hypothetical protein QE152_g14037 [Popillia japonica]|uniref:Uncharacterized protein n=1 Tax=Popillia japonica TaxID=7064 RepID=A0AAW1LAH7_POPJA
MRADAFDTLCDKLPPDLQLKEYKFLLDYMQQCYNLAPLEIAENFGFNKRRQQKGESVQEYLTALQKLAINFAIEPVQQTRHVFKTKGAEPPTNQRRPPLYVRNRQYRYLIKKIPSQDHYGANAEDIGLTRTRRSKGNVSLDWSGEPDNGEVKVAPRSEAGVVDVLGEEYVGQHGIKRTCEIKNSVRPEVSTLSQDSTTIRASSPTTFAATKTLGRLSQPVRQAPSVQAANQQQQQQQAQSRIQPQQIQQPQAMQQRQSVPVMMPQFRPQFIITPQFVQNKSLDNHLRGDFSDQKVQEFAKLMRYVDGPNMQAQTMTKQDILKKDNADGLENIDRVLKSDRSGFNLFRDVSYAPNVKQDETAKDGL